MQVLGVRRPPVRGAPRPIIYHKLTNAIMII